MEPIRNADVFRNFELTYWSYYLDLENDFLLTKKYVDFSEGNFDAYSLEFLKLFQAVCSEIDVVGKMMARYIDSAFDIEECRSIKTWWEIIKESYFLLDSYFTAMNPTRTPTLFKIKDYKCYLVDRIELHPWIGNDNDTPDWWKDYNKVKHRRSILDSKTEELFYIKANLKNVANAFAGLYVLEKAFMDSVGTGNNLEAFAGFSKLFVKRENATLEQVHQILD